MQPQTDLFGGILDSPEDGLNTNPSGDCLPAGETPLAERMRPRSWDELLGQDKILGAGTVLRKSLESGFVPSLILWGPPGSGKTSLARLIARNTAASFQPLSAVTSGVKDIRLVITQARHNNRNQQRTILFIDEIHRFNKAQQDLLLPHVENGLVTLIGATTENPSFEVNSALLSRCRVYQLNALSEDDLVSLLQRALSDSQHGLGAEDVACTDEHLRELASASQGDARAALSALELAVRANPQRPLELKREELLEALQRKALLYDKTGEQHYNLISAFHKSLRGSDGDAALYWLTRMLESGEDPRYVARRMIRFASEDIGNADPQALPLALAAWQTYQMLGSPEGELAIIQAALYLATAPKSNACYIAEKAARALVRKTGALPPPKAICNAPTELMKKLGYGYGYQYDHDSPEGYLPQEYFPEGLEGQKLYQPVERGFEREINKRLRYWSNLKQRAQPGADAERDEGSNQP